MTSSDENGPIISDIRDYLQNDIIGDVLKDQQGLNVKWDNRDGFKKEHGIN